MVQQTADIMFDKLLVIPAWRPVNEVPVFDLHLCRQEAFDFNAIVVAVYLLLLELSVHLVVADLVI
jgi:hypothetical protein